MRSLGFQEKWDKLKQDTFTTFRFTRRDRDWQLGELVQVVFKPRSKEREVLGKAVIINKVKRYIVKPGYPLVTYNEIKQEGFTDYGEMYDWLAAIYGGDRLFDEPMNKLTLRWKK